MEASQSTPVVLLVLLLLSQTCQSLPLEPKNEPWGGWESLGATPKRQSSLPRMDRPTLHDRADKVAGAFRSIVNFLALVGEIEHFISDRAKKVMRTVARFYATEDDVDCTTCLKAWNKRAVNGAGERHLVAQGMT